MARIISVAPANAQTEPVNDAEGADDPHRACHLHRKRKIAAGKIKAKAPAKD